MIACIGAHTRDPRDRRARPAEAGFSMVDVLISTVILVTALLAHAQCVITTCQMNQATTERGMAVETLGRFMERMRADDDWAGLYARLRPRSAESAGDVARTRLGIDLALPAVPATTYYSDFIVPPSLGTVSIVVQVPLDLCESANAPRYGLPADLNGDGTVDPQSRAADYTALPVVVHMRWERGSQERCEVVLATWLRGER